MRTTLIAIALLLLSLAAPPAFADTDAADYLEFDLDALMDMDVVYGASTYEQKVSEAPSSVTIITSEDIEAYGYRTLAEALHSVAGFYNSYDRNYDYMGIRGFSRPGDYNTRMLVLVDGHRINDNIYQSGQVGTEFPVDIELVKRIEVVRGPSSSLYGGSAFFGVVNIMTKGGADYEGSEISGQVGSFGSYTGRYTLGQPLRGDMSAVLSVSGFSTDGDDLFYPEFMTRDDNYGVTEGTDDDQAQRVFAKISGNRWELSGVYTNREKGIPTGAWGMVYNDSGSRDYNKRAYLNLSYNAPVSETSSLEMRAFFDRYDFVGDYRWDYAEDGEDPDIQTNKDTALGQQWGLGLRWDAQLGSRHRLLAGSDFRHHFQRFQDNYDTDPYWLYLETDEATSELGLYAQDEISLGETIKINLGLRFDSTSEYESLNPRLALMHTPVAGSTFKALYGTAFRAPNAYELYYGDYDVQIPSPDLEPEGMESFELVWEQTIGKKVSAALSMFNYNIDELITQVENEDELLEFKNLDHVQSSGLELSVDTRLMSRLQGRASYSFQDTRDNETDEVLSNSPRHMAKLNLLAKSPATSTSAGLEWIYVSERKTVYDSVTDGYLVTNLSGSWSLFHDQVTLAGTVYNLFDVAYADPGSVEHVQEVLPRDGRVFRAKLMYGF